MCQKVALITGIGGQDGSYLAELLLEKGYKVRGIIRRASLPNTRRIESLVRKYGPVDDLESPFVVRYADMTDAQSIRAILEKFEPDEVYNIAAQSHVGISFENAESTININTLGTLRVLDSLRHIKPDARYYQASSSEMFGISPPPQSETTAMLPQSPYGISKLAAYHFTRLYRNAYGLYASNGILFNHESPRRGYNFVTRKITRELARILVGEIDAIYLGNLDTKRDWGFSKEYVGAMWAILQQPRADDWVISTEETHTIRDFLREAFSLVGLEHEPFIRESAQFRRPAEVPALLGDCTKARRHLKWSPQVKFKELVRMMVEADLKEKFEETGVVPIVPGLMREDGFYIAKGRELAGKLKGAAVGATSVVGSESARACALGVADRDGIGDSGTKSMPLLDGRIGPASTAMQGAP